MGSWDPPGFRGWGPPLKIGVPKQCCKMFKFKIGVQDADFCSNTNPASKAKTNNTSCDDKTSYDH